MAEETDELADVPPEEFVAARDELAKRLKAEGNTDEAAKVKKIRKPTVTQWVTDQVRRHHAGDVDALGVDHHDEVAGVEVGRVARLVLALEDLGDIARQAAQGLTVGVDQVPGGL